MFYNHAEETAKRRRQSLSLGDGNAWPIDRKKSATTGASTTAPSSVSGADAFTTGGSSSVHNSEQSHARPAWPPSHAEIVADAQNEGLLHTGDVGPSIPMWYRGPLLLAGKLDLPSVRSRSTRGGFSSGGSGLTMDVPDPVVRPERSGIQGLSSWLSSSSVGSTPTGSDRDAEDEHEVSRDEI